MTVKSHRGSLKERRKDARGAAIIEFAIVLPLFLVLLFGLVEFSLVLYYKGLITHASREGARRGAIYAMPRLTGSQVQTWVQDYLTGVGVTAPVTVTVTGAGGATGNPLTVKVDLTYQYVVLPNLIGMLGPSLTLTAETVMRLE